MAKLSRDQLKSIVKECLVEILAEGLASDAAPLQEAIQPRSVPRPARSSAPIPANAVRRPPPTTQRFQDAVSRSVKTITDNPVLQEVLENTAKTTLQQQMSHEGAPTSLVGTSPEPSVDLGAFDETGGRWADLAFAPSVRRTS